MFQHGIKRLVTLLILMLTPVMASALDFKSVAVPKAVLYDAPSNSARKTLLLSQYYPVEIIVNLGNWLKVRDAQGSISWVEAKQLSNKRTVIVITGQMEMKSSPDAASNPVARLEKDVVLELVDLKLHNGWVQVKHRDGVTGYIPISSTWGFN